MSINSFFGNIANPNRYLYDCEVVKMIPSDVIDDKYEYCLGWRDFDNLGISVICLANMNYPYILKIYTKNGILGTQTFDELISFLDNNSIEIYGFNSKSFDDLLCEANGIPIATDFDVLEVICYNAFKSTNWRDHPKGYSYSLSKIAKVNGLEKTGSAELAAKLWQDGYYQKVIDYCINDCVITVKIVELIQSHKLIDPNTGRRLFYL